MEVDRAFSGQASYADAARQRKVYSPPTLIVFGRVAALTQSASGCDMGDNAGCAVVTGTMGPMTSDRRVKEHVRKIGLHPLGIGLYLFNYKPDYLDACGHGRQFGVMADEVEAVMPEAVVEHPNGYKMVNYGLLGITKVI